MTRAKIPHTKRRKIPQHPRSQNIFMQYVRLFRFYMVTGLLVWVPLIVTVWVTWWLFKSLGLGLENATSQALTWLQERVTWLPFLNGIEIFPGMGFGAALLIFLLTGILTRYLVGVRLISTGERILDKIPFIRNVYRAVQQIRDVFVSREGTIFQEVCLVEYPKEGMYAVAFITSRDQGIVQKSAGKEMLSVFLPTTPNPTSGFLLYLPPEDVTILDISIEDAMKLIISGGAYLPDAKSSPEMKEVDPPVKLQA